MSTEVVRLVSPRVGLACAAVLALAACEREGAAPAPGAEGPNAEIAWARSALERNPQIEVVASDPEQQVFTIRDRRTGDVHAVKLAEIAAAPIAQLQAPASAPPAQAAESSGGAQGSAPEPTSPGGQQ